MSVPAEGVNVDINHIKVEKNNLTMAKAALG